MILCTVPSGSPLARGSVVPTGSAGSARISGGIHADA